ncbi:unnamed protein product [Moneuplotes crassus]|uniref:Uncharacterized protein n=1 Tax=Euplotes crassus TaxID=5936 RepID=A0AAD1UCR5_EUPCR|nr:unnamed protein product [Moneuplotes crassus]
MPKTSPPLKISITNSKKSKNSLKVKRSRNLSRNITEGSGDTLRYTMKPYINPAGICEIAPGRLITLKTAQQKKPMSRELDITKYLKMRSFRHCKAIKINLKNTKRLKKETTSPPLHNPHISPKNQRTTSQDPSKPNPTTINPSLTLQNPISHPHIPQNPTKIPQNSSKPSASIPHKRPSLCSPKETPFVRYLRSTLQNDYERSCLKIPESINAKINMYKDKLRRTVTIMEEKRKSALKLPIKADQEVTKGRMRNCSTSTELERYQTRGKCSACKLMFETEKSRKDLRTIRTSDFNKDPKSKINYKNPKTFVAKWQTSDSISPKKHHKSSHKIPKSSSQPLFKFEYSKNYYNYGDNKDLKFYVKNIGDLVKTQESQSTLTLSKN